MRLDARTDACAILYQVFDCEDGCYRNDVVWVDDEAGEYGVYIDIVNSITKGVKARILIIPEIRLIYINPKLSKDELVNDMADVILGDQSVGTTIPEDGEHEYS